MAEPGGHTPSDMKGPKPLTVVIKLGTSSIVDEKTHEPLLSILTLIVETAVKLRKDGHKVVIVSSGAIGVGLRRMDVDKRPKHLSKLQALAAIGQCRLMSLWDSLFGHLRQPIAQVLLTRNDIADRTRYLNAQNTMMELLEMGVIPIVNENDTLAVAEIKFGDNDTLSAITAAMVHAHFLFLMTDVDCLYDKNPRTHPDARAIEEVEDISAIRADVSSAGSSLGTGGMSTKIVAARLATSAGVTTVITRSSSPGNIVKIVRYLQARKKRTPSHHSPVANDEEHLSRSTASLNLDALEKPPLHTRFLPLSHPIRDRYFWILHGLAPHGTVYIDAGAHQALADKAGLLPVGVLDVEGNFAQQEAVRLVVVKRLSEPGPNGKLWEGPGDEIGRALVNYAAPEIIRIKGHRSAQIGSLLGYADSEYVADRESISLLHRESRPVTPVLEKLGENGGVAAYENDISL
ncbi:glutamate 5-kinase [Annulohypoxylon truncatum]|uniref:glutamate 5-kinase n=1 Tax=Annulohypoxylon truncatum TaxID=327061 RepID=UPI00200857E6|nr:glutamate 5-kinase [Annulohypoxylon truncatum]KAI1212488.1 glutamate 5-kinase [Annulohypoxylon truncatum]